MSYLKNGWRVGVSDVCGGVSERVGKRVTYLIFKKRSRDHILEVGWLPVPLESNHGVGTIFN